MANVRFMQIAKSIEGLFHNLGRLRLCQMLFLCNVIKEFSSLAKLGYKETDPISLPCFMQLNNIRMVKLLQDRNFVLKSIVVLNFAFLHCFHCYFYSCLLLLGEVHSSIATTSKFLFKVVFILNIALSRIYEQLTLYLNALPIH